MIIIICNYCNKKLNNSSCYCSEKCRIKNEIRMKPLYDWDKNNPNANQDKTKERYDIWLQCRNRK